MTFAELPDYWWAPLAVLLFAALVANALLDIAGPRHASLAGLRFYFVAVGLALIYIGVVLLRFAPVGGRIDSPMESQVMGAVALALGMGAMGVAAGNAMRVRLEYARNNRTRHVDPDPARYVSPRERVLGKDSGDEEPQTETGHVKPGSGR